MSWLSGLAGRAEDLLNKLDENAAQTLKVPSSRMSSNSKREDDSTKERKPPAQKKKLPDRWRTNSLPAKPTSLQVQKSTLPHKVDKEAKPKPVNPSRKLTSNLHTPSKSPKKGLPSLDDTLMLSSHDRKLYDHEDTRSEGIKTLLDLISLEEPQKDKSSIKSRKDVKDTGAKDDSIIALESENKMLQNELCIINDQVSVLVQKAKNVEKLNEALQAKVYNLETDYIEAIRKKDLACTEVEKYKTMVHNLNTISRPDTSNLETALRVINEENRVLVERVKELEESNNNLELTVMSTTSLKAKLENELMASQTFCTDLETQLKLSKEDVVKLEKDLEMYKIRAKGLLSVKEKLIEEMQKNDMNDSTKVLVSQIEQLKNERDESLNTMSKVTAEYEIMRRSARQSESQRSTSEKSNTALREAIRQERTAKEKAEHALNSLTRELKSAQIETSQQLAVLRSKLRDRDSELQRFQLSQATSYTTGAMSDTDTCSGTLNVASSSERESSGGKLHRLSQALVAKQAALDSMMADRNALRLQLEKTENRYRSDLIAGQGNRLQSRIINFQDNVTDDVKASSRSDLSGKGTIVSNTFRDAYSGFWTTSVKIGVFLRRHPMMRIMIFGYMAVLHLWVMIVIVTYTPEVHTT